VILWVFADFCAGSERIDVGRLGALKGHAPMTNTQREALTLNQKSATRLSSIGAIALAISFGLCAGFLDVGIIFLSKYFWHSDGYFRIARDFPWTVPAGHVVLLLVPGILVAALAARSRGISLRAGLWVFASLAIWAALLRSPLYPVCTLLLALGLGRFLGDAIAARGLRPRYLGLTVLGLLGVLGVFAAMSSGWQAVRERRGVAGLPAAPERASNVILIVWDTVRSYDVSSYGFSRDATPNLTQWAQKGVQFNHALAAAPWTYPSHTSFFTGQWPKKLNSQWKFTLDTPDPTLAEYLTSQGYQTAGFAANTSCCTYESGLSRGFSHWEDYALTPLSLLTRTVPGKWMLLKVLDFGGFYRLGFNFFYEKKWQNLESRGARDVNERFLNWLSGRRPDRPFFAFLNYFDAHEPFIPPPSYENGFGIKPKTPEEYQFLFDYVGANKATSRPRDLVMARDCYDDCILFLDEQLGRLLGLLKKQGLLENTTVIITADHGEGFGDHGIFGHSYTVNLDEIGVPLVILSPQAPARRFVPDAVSLRDLPATVVDLLGLSSSSPFPGRSLAAHWKSTSQDPARQLTTPAFSERVDATALVARSKEKLDAGWFQMSIVARGMHYMRDSTGVEQLFDLTIDPFEAHDIVSLPDSVRSLQVLRKLLLEVLSDEKASLEVENSYLKPFRDQLESLIVERDPSSATASF